MEEKNMRTSFQRKHVTCGNWGIQQEGETAIVKGSGQLEDGLVLKGDKSYI